MNDFESKVLERLTVLEVEMRTLREAWLVSMKEIKEQNFVKREDFKHLFDEQIKEHNKDNAQKANIWLTIMNNVVKLAVSVLAVSGTVAVVQKLIN